MSDTQQQKQDFIFGEDHRYRMEIREKERAESERLRLMEAEYKGYSKGVQEVLEALGVNLKALFANVGKQ
jgi:hypothetical protein